MPKSQTYLIDAPAGRLEVEALWQNDDPNNAKTQMVAVLCHPNPLFDGTMTNKVVTTMFRFARDNGMHAVRFNFRGVGQSTGDHDYGKGEVEDALCVLQWLNTQTSARALWLGGFSFGGYVTARVAEQLMLTPHVWGLNEFDINKVVLVAPSVENNEVNDLTLPTQKTIQIYGDADAVIKPDSMAQFAKNKNITSHVVAQAGHFFHGKLGELKALLERHG